jgi:CheY-like chemotaxis protein
MSKLNSILLVDDNPCDVELTLNALKAQNFANEVAVMRDGLDALDYLRRYGAFSGRSVGNPAMVLLDIKMPKLNGLEVLAVMKSDPALRTIPVVMLTSSCQEPDLAKAYELGANAYVVKPVDFQKFMDAVEQAGAFRGVLNEPPLTSARHSQKVNAIQ